jgi:hypothetical protein
MDDVLDAMITRDAAFADEQAAGQPGIALVTRIEPSVTKVRR